MDAPEPQAPSPEPRAPSPEPRAPSPEPRAPLLWWDDPYQEDLRERLMAPCWSKVRGDPTDLVNEALLKTHLRIMSAPAADPIVDPTGLAMKILHDTLVDSRRRTEWLDCEEPDALPAALPRQAMDMSQAMFDRLTKFFRGRIQRAILLGLVVGETIAAVAERLGIEVKEAHRVAGEMEARLWGDS